MTAPKLIPCLIALTLSSCSVDPSSAPDRFAVKVLTIAMFEIGDMTGDIPGEAQLWIERQDLAPKFEIPGADGWLYCNDRAHCLALTQMGIANSAATMMAVGLDPRLDLTRTYFIVAGIAGTPPSLASIGSAAWAEWVVEADFSHSFDARELPDGFEHAKFRFGCSEPWCEDRDPFGFEAFQLNKQLTARAYKLSKDIELASSPETESYGRNYPAAPAHEKPVVTTCDSLAGSTFWHGKRSSEWATWWVDQWTEHQGKYCMANMEDSATLLSLKRLADAQRLDFNRIMVLRTTSNYDQPYPGQAITESLWSQPAVSRDLAVENAYRVGMAVAEDILSNWTDWE